MIHPTYKGALFINSLTQPLINKYFKLVSQHANKVLGFAGIPARDEKEEGNKKSE